MCVAKKFQFKITIKLLAKTIFPLSKRCKPSLYKPSALMFLMPNIDLWYYKKLKSCDVPVSKRPKKLWQTGKCS